MMGRPDGKQVGAQKYMFNYTRFVDMAAIEQLKG